jgi:ABC-2 type transport system ATP-binding protein
VFQSETLVRELTAYENMDIYGSLYRVPRKLRAGRIKNLLDLFDLWERRDDPVSRFSGGMRRRLEIARCLLHSPKIIFLDEPTVGLDPQTRHLLWDQVTKINQQEGVTVFLTTHYLEEVEQVAHCIAVIDHGKIIAQGSAAQLKQQTAGDTLEEAFLKLTGLSIRPEKVTNLDRLRNVAKVPGW